MKLLARTGLDWTEKYLTTAKALAAISAQQAYIDGELCAVAKGGITSFGLSQAATDHRVTGSLIFSAFDLVYLDGENLMAAPLADRKQRLEQLLEKHERPIRSCDHQVGLGPQFHQSACKLGPEGVVSKRLDAPYAGQSRGAAQDEMPEPQFVVVGWTDPEGARPDLGALLLAYYDPDGRLTYAGRKSLSACGADCSRSLSARCRCKLLRRAQAASARRLSCPGCIGCGRNLSWRSIT